MVKTITVLALVVWLSVVPSLSASAAGVGPMTDNIAEDQTFTGQERAAAEGRVQEQAYRSAPGAYRGGVGRGTTRTSPGTGYTTGPRAPSANVGRTPTGGGTGAGVGSVTGGRFGSFFGGLAAGAFIGHLFNPFAGWGGGYYGGGGMFVSFISLLLWVGMIYAAYRLVRWFFRGRVR